jgi:UDP-glucose 4-epimerase
MSSLRMKTVILGDSGFIGRRLREHLTAQGGTVHGFSSRMLDLRRPDGLAALDELVDAGTTLVVTAALAPPRGGTLDGLADNLAMATNVARYLEGHAVGKCVYFSSDAVYPLNGEPVTEATPVAATNYYALGKIAGEDVLRLAAEAKRIPLLVLRPTAVYGPGDTHSSYGPNRFCRSIVRERGVRLFGAGEETRDHLYVDDLVALTARLSASDASGVYNLATGTSHTFGAIVEELRRIAPDAFEVAHAPRAGAVTHRQFDVSRLLAAVPGFQFAPLAEGLAATFLAARAEGT